MNQPRRRRLAGTAVLAAGSALLVALSAGPTSRRGVR